ncbi:unnamed protein product [Cyclocybe aegerita]|uniref:Uncharacterized protein n=1 Tax=Cyclocybe aegerita TaxID=1973307 RepID=A0A8S0W4Q7_CYCAE|nr:unnamed protein product [Cyclocybe aegerita]
MMDLGKKIKAAAGTAKSNDSHHISKAIPVWWRKLHPDSVPIPDNKVKRGFKNPVTSHLLCPAVLDWDDPNIQSALCNRIATIPGPDGPEAVSGVNWPNFLYDGPYDPKTPWVGLLRSHLLVMAYMHVFIAPSSVATHDAEDSSSQSTRSGNAHNNGMTSVNAALLTYVAAQVYFALSDEGAFHKSNKKLDAVTFYESLVMYLEDPDNEKDNKELFDHWNRLIFPESITPVARGKNTSNAQIKAARLALQHEADGF